MTGQGLLVLGRCQACRQPVTPAVTTAALVCGCSNGPRRILIEWGDELQARRYAVALEPAGAYEHVWRQWDLIAFADGGLGSVSVLLRHRLCGAELEAVPAALVAGRPFPSVLDAVAQVEEHTCRTERT